MPKPILGFDLDGVIYPWQIACFEYVTLYCGYTGTYEDLFTTSNFFSGKNKLWQENITSLEHLYSAFPPRKQDIDLLHELSNKYDIIYITQRPEAVRLTTEQYLHRYGYPNKDNLILSQDKILDIRASRCDWYVEDRPEYAIPLQKITNVILFTQPWNNTIRDQFKYKIETLQGLREILC